MATADIAGMRDSRGQHTGVPRGNIRAKPLDYIEQVFECKADTLELFAWVLRNLAGKAQQTTIRSSEFFWNFELQIAIHAGLARLARARHLHVRSSGFQLLLSLRVRTCSQRACMNNVGDAPAFLDIAYPIT